MNNDSAKRIKTLRQQHGLTEDFLSQELNLSKADYYDLEAYDDELETCISFAQIKISRNLSGHHVLPPDRNKLS